jgi:hypothetical protein
MIRIRTKAGARSALAYAPHGQAGKPHTAGPRNASGGDAARRREGIAPKAGTPYQPFHRHALEVAVHLRGR